MSGIYKAIANVMAEITPIAKGKLNKQQGFNYRGVDDVMNELSPILAKHRVFIYPEVISKEREERQSRSGGNNIYSILTIKYHFATDDGSEVTSIVIGEGMDSGDKASNKALAAAFKYVCLQMFCIPTEDGLEDPDKTTPPSSLPNMAGNSSNEPTSEAEKRQIIIGEMRALLNEKDSGGAPYFTDDDKRAEKLKTQRATTIDVLIKQKNKIKDDLEKRKGNEGATQ